MPPSTRRFLKPALPYMLFSKTFSCIFIINIPMQTFIEILRIFPKMKQNLFPVLLYYMDLLYNNISIRIVIMQAHFSFLYICYVIICAVHGCRVISLKFQLTSISIKEKQEALNYVFLSVIRN
jgi:hypothetical protein